jgi:hypothetical protein
VKIWDWLSGDGVILMIISPFRYRVEVWGANLMYSFERHSNGFDDHHRIRVHGKVCSIPLGCYPHREKPMSNHVVTARKTSTNSFVHCPNPSLVPWPS